MAFANALRSKRIHRANRFGMRRSATNRSSASRRVLTLASGRARSVERKEAALPPFPVSRPVGLMSLNGLNAAQARAQVPEKAGNETTGRRFNFDRRNAPTRLRLSFCVDFLFLDVVDHEEVLALLLLLDVGRRQRGLGADRLEADEGERAHQVRAVEAVLADAQHDAVALELLLGKLQQRDERVLRGLVRHRRRQVHVQHVVERAEDRLPGAELLRGHKQLQRDLGGCRLGQHLLDDGGLMLVHVVNGRFGEIKIGILRRSGGGRINRCLAIVFFQGRRPIVVGSGCWDIRTTTAALQPTKHSRSRSPPTRRRKRRRTTTTKSCVYRHDYYYSLAHFPPPPPPQPPVPLY